MKALIVEISFSEAFFKVHYTRGFRLTYPIPLPTTVAGIFGAFAGVKREELKEKFRTFFFGAKAKRHDGIVNENATFLQYKSKGVERGVTQISIINNPTFLIAIASSEKEIVEFEKRIEEKIEFLPYGGQNDFFPLEWKIRGFEDVEELDEITSYAPRDWVASTILERNSEIQILPVRHNLSSDINFYFIINGKLRLNRKILATINEKIGLYKLENFSVGLNEQMG